MILMTLIYYMKKINANSHNHFLGNTKDFFLEYHFLSADNYILMIMIAIHVKLLFLIQITLYNSFIKQLIF